MDVPERVAEVKKALLRRNTAALLKGALTVGGAAEGAAADGKVMAPV